jgi:putative lipoic acid-binding regulatory protein
MSGEHPKTIGDGDETLLKFPTPFPIKAMGRMIEGDVEGRGDGPVKGKVQSGFAQIVIDIILKHAPDLDSGLVEMRPSKNGNFVSVTATINATSKQQLDAIYRELSAHPLVLMAL